MGQQNPPVDKDPAALRFYGGLFIYKYIAREIEI